MDIWRSVVGLLVGLAGVGTIALYTRINGKSRGKGVGAHWGIGIVLGTLGMSLTLSGWALLCFSEPAISLGFAHYAGTMLAIFGASLYAVSALRVGRWTPPPHYSLDLRTDGIYSHIRHPQALGLCVLALGLGLWSGSIPYLVTLPLWLGFWTAYTYLEEKNELIPAFGDQYLKYRETTPRLIPRLLPVRTAREEIRRAGRSAPVSASPIQARKGKKKARAASVGGGR
jgi:protein-S-isoprenylcysteine O-methyltransferase Ste14